MKRKQKGIDMLRLRVLHTKRMTVSEIAAEMGITSSEAEYELKKMGYVPIYKRDVPEKSEFVRK